MRTNFLIGVAKGKTMVKLANRVGICLAVAHLLLFVGCVLYVNSTYEGQASLIWVTWAIVDFPVSLIYVLFAESYSKWLQDALQGKELLQQVLYLPHVVNGLLGTVWWYLLPKLLTPTRIGGVWGTK
ncbi:MAG TPA: hypothetical protein VM260_10930 [Pirellula sp.]|nr:hypothetical protein [Pirellula sp.]